MKLGMVVLGTTSCMVSTAGMGSSCMFLFTALGLMSCVYQWMLTSGLCSTSGEQSFGIAHLTSEGHLEENGYGCTGHHQLYGVNSWYGELLHVSDHCSWVDELCVPMDASFRAYFNQ